MILSLQDQNRLGAIGKQQVGSKMTMDWLIVFVKLWNKSKFPLCTIFPMYLLPWNACKTT